MFRKLIDVPEVLDILVRNITYTAELGDIYRRNPDGVKARAAEMQLERARENAEADKAWAQSIENDPQALAELEQSSQDFAAQDSTPTFVYHAPEPQSNVTVIVRHYPYSYWYGYPAYYRYPYWYPRPYWYHTGYYVSSNGTIIIVGTPSYHYTNWYFYGHHHHYHYSHLSYHYARHYDHHRHHEDGAIDAIRDWERENRDRLPKDWAAERRDGADRFREFGEKNADRSLPGDQRQRLTTATRSVERGERSDAMRRQLAADNHDRSWRRNSSDQKRSRSGGAPRGRFKRN